MDAGGTPPHAARTESPLRVLALMILSVALLVALGTLALLPLFVLTQPCPVALRPCDTTSAPLAALLMLGVPLAAVLAGLVGAGVQLARRRRAVRWPAIACAVAVVSWLAGLAVALLA